MKVLFTKAIMAAAVATVSMVSTSAQADVFNQFTIRPDAGPNGAKQDFYADKITGQYTEIATFKPDGTFDVELYWNAGQFVTNGGTRALNANVTGLGSDYGVYAVYRASGFFVTGTTTTFNFAQGTGSLQMFIDKNADTDVDAVRHADGSASFVIAGNGADDIEIANGIPLFGQGTLDPNRATCGPGKGILCGDFASTTTFNLTNAGSAFFVAPSPFFNLSFQSGQQNNFQVSGTQIINGSLDVVFDNPVPEPASLGLLGLGLLGLGLSRRRQG